MKIVFNGLQFTKYNSGIGKMMQKLFTNIANDSKYKSVLILPKDSQESIENVETIKIPYKNSEGFKRNFYQSFIMGKKYCENSILIITDSKVPFFMPKNSIVLPVITDLALYEMPEVYKLSRVILWKIQYRYLINHTNKFIAVSEYTKNDINKFLGIDKDKIDVVYCAADENIKRVDDKNILNSVRDKYNLPDKYFLFIGNLNPRKNLSRLYKAYKEVKKKLNIPHKLVIAGEHGWKYKRLLNSLKKDEDIIFTGYIDESDKASLYTMADIFIFPSLKEGGTWALMEAMAIGLPVVCLDWAGMAVETTSDTAIQIPVSNPRKMEKDFGHAISLLINSQQLRKQIGQAARKRIKEVFNWNAKGLYMEALFDEIDNR